MSGRSTPLPLAAIRTSAAGHVVFAAAAAGMKSAARKFSGVAYGGGVILDHPSLDNVVFDIGTTKLATPAPALYGHGSPVGVIKAAVLGDRIEITGDLFSDIDPRAGEIASMSDRGMPWQMSVGIWPGRIEAVPAGKAVKLNGRTFQGPLTVFRDNRVREVSFCALGADSDTRAQVFNLGREVAGAQARARAVVPPAPRTASEIVEAATQYVAAQELAGRAVSVADAVHFVVQPAAGRT